MADYSPTIISKDDIICKSTEDIIYYQLSSSFQYYSINYASNTEILIMKNNGNKQKVNAGEINIIPSNDFLYLNNSDEEQCFYVHFCEEKNTISSEGEFYTYLFNLSQYYFTLKSDANIKRMQILFQKNYFYELSKLVLLNNNIEIKSLFLNSENYYVYQFERNSEEIPIILLFSTLHISNSYEKINFIFKTFKTELITIQNNFEKCIKDEEMFLVKPNDNKPYIEILHNNTYYLELNGKETTGQIFISTNSNNYVNIIGKENRIICLWINYYEKNIFDLEENKKINFKIVKSQKYTFKISNIIEEYNITISINQLNNFLNSPKIVIHSASSYENYNIIKNNKIYNISIKPKKEKLLLDIEFSISSSSNQEDISIYYSLIKDSPFEPIPTQKTDNTDTAPIIPEGLVIFIEIFGFLVLGLFIISICICNQDPTIKNKTFCYTKIKDRLASDYL